MTSMMLKIIELDSLIDLRFKIDKYRIVQIERLG